MMRSLNAMIVVLLISILPLGNAKQEEKKVARPTNKVKADFFDLRQIGLGQSITAQLGGKRFSAVQSANLSPSEGILIGEIKEVKSSSDDQERGYRKWAIPITVAKDAKPGKRSLTVVTPEGSVESPIEVIAQPIPLISDLKIISATSGDALSRDPSIKIEFTFSVQHEAALGAKVRLEEASANGSKGPHLFGRFTKYVADISRIETIDAKHSSVRHTFFISGMALGPFWDFRVSLRDGNGSWSNTLETQVYFNQPPR